MKIQKSVFTVTVLHTDDEGPTGFTSIDDLAYAMENNWIGGVSHTSTVDVPADEVREELLAMGNDGEFFDYRDA